MPESNLPQNIRSIIATDCGSTTTKAILIEKREGVFRLVVRGESPTTVEAPFEDVTRGVLNAILEVEELAGRRILEGEKIITPQTGDDGVDLYISTSSAGGGLQMVVSGVVKSMTAESAQRAALGAGAIVMDIFATNDNRKPFQKIERIRQLRPDMILLAGGTDGGTVKHVVAMAELIAAAGPRARLGANYKLPVIYAGNDAIQTEIRNALDDTVDLTVVENVRPVLEAENLGPARDKIHDLFMEHVMAQAPGYKKLMAMADAAIMPTPGAVGLIMKTIADHDQINILGADIGGATTDVFSVFDGQFNRTVSANLGMSYSICNVLAEAGLPNILRWIPFEIEERTLRDAIGNKMVRPTTIPQTIDGLIIEQAICREALRISFEQHREFAAGLKGVQKQRTISETFDAADSSDSIVDLVNLDLLVGSGGVLSHAPRRQQAFMMMIDAFQPEGITQIAVDSIFMMPQLGVLTTLHREAAMQVFHHDCLVRLGTCVVPVGRSREGKPCLHLRGNLRGTLLDEAVPFGAIRRYPLTFGEPVELQITLARGFSLGSKGREVAVSVNGGDVGLVIDTRGRPMEFPNDTPDRKELNDWNQTLGLYARPD